MATKRQTINAMRLLIDQFGAQIALEHQPPLPRDKRERLGMQMAVEDHAINWHTERLWSLDDCTLNGGINIGLVNYSGVTDTPHGHDPLMPQWSNIRLPRESRVAVIGPAPTFEDAEKGEVGWSRADRLLGQTLRKAGLEDGQITWIHCVWCWPDGGIADAPSSRGRSRGRQIRIPRPPTTRELNDWHPMMMAALDAADVDYVLLHGHQAVHAWRPDMSVEKALGAQFIWANRWMVSAVHHASYLSRERDAQVEREWREGVAQFVYRAVNGITWDAFARRCVLCKSGSGGGTGTFYAWDEDGVAVCEKHMKDNWGKATAARKKSKELIGQHNQKGML